MNAYRERESIRIILSLVNIWIKSERVRENHSHLRTRVLPL